MPLVLKSFLSYSTVVFICVCVECVKIQPLETNLSTVGLSSIGINRIPEFVLESAVHNNTNNFSHDEESLKNVSISKVSPTKHLARPIDQEVHKVVNKELNEFALEGGGTGFPLQNSSVKSQEGGVFDEELHIKGSKGRKGVGFPESSVVPRKGVSDDHIGDPPSNNSTNVGNFTNKPFLSNNTKIVMGNNVSLSTGHGTTKLQEKVQFQETPSLILNTTHSKKPEYVSDEKDVDSFEKYSIIKTSTTGEDYVIIGIVIVIGIWFSVFGALIFYRRAGEYWDRRHYRRMDFLVEGMYND